MKRLAAALVFCALAASAASAARAQEPDLQVTLTAAMRETAVPAVGVLVIRDGQVAGQAARGVRRLGQPDPVGPGDRWHIGSNGKSMTATLVARLVERGQLSWDAPLSALLPELAADMRPEYRAATLQDLMSHRAGLPENISDMAFFATFATDARPLPEQRLAYLRRALAEPPAGPARDAPSYSNTGFLLAGAIAERAAGKPFEQLMQEEVFAPLGMTSAAYDQIAAPGEIIGHVDGRLADRAEDLNPPMFSPAGGVRLTLEDWAKFCIDQMAGEQGRGKLLTAESYRRLHRGQGETRSALGWGAAPSPMGLKGPALSHSGSDGNNFAVVLLFPETGNGVVTAANAADSMGGDKAVMAATRAVAATLAPPAAP